MLISIIIPNYNYAQYLPSLFLSLARQTFPHDQAEIIFVDDGSTDDSVEIATRWKEILDYREIHIITQSHVDRPGPVRNTGVQHAKGDFLLFIDSDDTLSPQYIEECAIRMNLRPEVDVVYTDCIIGGENSRLMQLPKFSPGHMKVQNIVMSTALVRTETFLKTSGYKANTGYEDWDLWIQMIQLGAIFSRVPKALMTYNQHSDGYFQSKARPKDALSKATLVLNNPGFFEPETLRWALGYTRREPWAVSFQTGIIPQKDHVRLMLETFSKINASKRPTAEKIIFSRWLEPPKFIPVAPEKTKTSYHARLGERMAV
ncbi:MAG: glycosyltransferase family 2 protein [Desulfovibrio sp.]